MDNEVAKICQTKSWNAFCKQFFYIQDVLEYRQITDYLKCFQKYPELWEIFNTL